MAKAANRLTYEVHLDAPELGVNQLVGKLYRHATRTDFPPAFEYDQAWLKGEFRFALDPRLELYRSEQHPPADAPAFGVFMDSAPDRWGRVLMERREAAAAERDQRQMRTFHEMDFLLGVFDHTRMGGLRFCEPGGVFLDNHLKAAPPATDLKELAHISRRIEEPGVEKLPEYERWLAMLIAPGTSLGGARPKANFTDDDKRLWIAKFPAKDDRYDVGGWEYLMHVLSRKAGIVVPEARLEHLTSNYGTFCSSRFDRVDGGRRMYASAMTLLERRDGQGEGSYLDLVEFISDHGAQGHVDADLAQLFRRVLFNILVGNRDDHLRNHGFIRETTGWRLSPVFDVNPNTAKQEHALAIDSNNAAPNIGVAMEQAELYRLSAQNAQAVLDEVKGAIAGWRKEAEKLRLPASEVKRMETVIQA
nr:HipA domain-containing protein [uncultured Cupriavidus sp.]